MADIPKAPYPAFRESNAILTMALGACVLAVAAIGAFILVLQFADSERDRDLRIWQTRLGIIAETRAGAVDDWLSAQFTGLKQLADNQSLQLYMTELAHKQDSAPGVTQGLAESGYLRNLLTVIAERSGFTAPLAGPDVNANVRRLGAAGIALVSADGRVLVATDAMPPLQGRLRRFLLSAQQGEPALLDMYRGATGAPSMAFSVPVFAVQAGGTREIGRIIAIRGVGALTSLMEQPGAVWRDARAVLVRRNGGLIEYLSPTADGRLPLARSMAADTKGLAARFALERTGGFAQKSDYRNTTVLVTSRRITRAPWALMYKIDRDEALAESDDRRSRLIAILGLAIALVVLAILVAWRHGASRRSARIAGLYGDLAHRLEAQSRLLRLVTDSQPSPMFIVDSDGTYQFANRAAAIGAGMKDDDMIGKSMSSVIGAAEAEKYLRLNRDVLDSGAARTEIRRHGSNGDLRVVQSEHIPVASGAALPPGIMIVEDDITVAVTERERRERTLAQLIETLLTVVDRRDPYAADHSIRVARVARAVAEEMGLDEIEIRTAETAGRLMNLGKILVPSDILARAGTLSREEIRQVRDSIELSAELVEGVEFDGPVVETLRQLRENWDGSGSPSGLAGEEILLTARVVSAANAFVAIISPRAWRVAGSIDEATSQMLAQIGKAFERRVVAALVNLLDNRGGAEDWMNHHDSPPLPGRAGLRTAPTRIVQ
ncbi:MAG: HD domain-containing phosphohydrolase [Alphaproteobacteria bacterium]